MDDFQKRAIGNHESRHRDKIRENAEQILEYAGYILRDLDNPGRRSVVSHYARGRAQRRPGGREAVRDAGGHVRRDRHHGLDGGLTHDLSPHHGNREGGDDEQA